VIALALAAAMTMPGPPPDGGFEVAIPGRYFAPVEAQVLAGQTVTWRNGDHAVHDIHADDGSFESGRLAPGGAFAHTFETVGRFHYVCRIHREMRGVIRVSALAITGPAAPVRAGQAASISVLASADTPSVTLERLEPSGPPTVVGVAAPDPGGNLSFSVPTDRPGLYRARAGELTSRVVAVRVAPAITFTSSRHGRVVRVRATVSPAQAGATVILAEYVRERFAYQPLRSARLDARSGIAWTLRTKRRLRLRVELTEPVDGFSVAASAPAVVRRFGDRGRPRPGPDPVLSS
jgi:plastocyanin